MSPTELNLIAGTSPTTEVGVFVGGPADRRALYVRKGAETVSVAETQESGAVLYKRTAIATESGNVSFFIWEGMSFSQALLSLLGHYLSDTPDEAKAETEKSVLVRPDGTPVDTKRLVQ